FARDGPVEHWRYRDNGECILIVGITGTRKGANPDQLVTMAKLFKQANIEQLAYGDCTGVDEQAYYMAKAFGARAHCHPPLNPEFRTYTTKNDIESIDERPKPYLERNPNIVE